MIDYESYVYVTRVAWVETVDQWSRYLHGTWCGEGEGGEDCKGGEMILHRRITIPEIKVMNEKKQWMKWSGKVYLK
jgi:hypothetical protein